jgi:hypothetical protein
MGIITVHNAALGVYPAFVSTARESPVRSRPYTSNSPCSSTNPSQDQHERVAEQDLVGAKWQLQPIHLTRALSYKTLKNDQKSLAPNQIDSISRYNVLTDSLSEEKLEAVAESLDVFDGQSLVSKQDHYQPLAKFLNDCLDKCRDSFPEFLGNYHSGLVFGVYDRQTKDGIQDMPPLKPSLVGVLAPFSDTDELSWSPPASEQNQMVLIPVELNEDRNMLIAKASIYARALYSASPLRQFALVIGYNHCNQELNFVVFHRGGVTISEQLSIQKVSDRMEILRLLLSILTWKTMGDAGIPEWVKGTQIRLPLTCEDTQGGLIELTQILSRNNRIRGRGQEVWRCTPRIIDKECSSSPPLVTDTTGVEHFGPEIPVSETEKNNVSEGSTVSSSSQKRRCRSEDGIEYDVPKRTRLKADSSLAEAATSKDDCASKAIQECKYHDYQLGLFSKFFKVLDYITISTSQTMLLKIFRKNTSPAISQQMMSILCSSSHGLLSTQQISKLRCSRIAVACMVWQITTTHSYCPIDQVISQQTICFFLKKQYPMAIHSKT